MRKSHIFVSFGLLLVGLLSWYLAREDKPSTLEEYYEMDGYGMESPLQTASDLPYAVTGLFNPPIITAGVEILDEGGSAMDASLAVALSQIASVGGKNVSYAGILNALYFDAETGKVYNLNASYNTVEEERRPKTIPKVKFLDPAEKDKVTNGRTVLVPGFMKGVGAAHERFGKLPFARIFEHAIQIAEDGYEWMPWDRGAFEYSKAILTKHPETRALFVKDDGSFYVVGDAFKQPQLAKTLRAVASKGVDYMYTGEWGRKFVETVQSAGGKVSMKDMENYAVFWSAPARVEFDEYVLYAHGVPSHGGITLLNAMRLAEVAGFVEADRNSRSAESLASFFKVMKASQILSENPGYYGDDFGHGPIGVLNDDMAEKVWVKISDDSVSENAPEPEFESNHSAAIVATDRWGNMVALIHSMNTMGWGRNGLSVDGVPIPDSATFQQDAIDRAGPGRRLPEWTVPGLVFKDGKPILGFSTVGEGITNQSAASLLNILANDMSLDDAILEPSFGGLKYENGRYVLLVEANRFPEDFIESSVGFGGAFKESPMVNRGSWTGLYRDYETGRLGATPVWDGSKFNEAPIRNSSEAASRK